MSKLSTNTTSLQSILEAVNNLPEAGSGGIELPELTAPANIDEVFLNKEYIDSEGNKQVGTFTIDSELTTQDDLIAQIQSAVDGLPEAGSGGSGNESNSIESMVYPYEITIFEESEGWKYFYVPGMITLFFPSVNGVAPDIGIAQLPDYSGKALVYDELSNAYFHFMEPNGPIVLEIRH